MVVDDEEDVRAVLRGTLGEKYEVVEAQDGLDAIEKLERYEPDFICMDVMMPMMDGFECCAAIRRSKKFSDVPVMFLTALGDKDSIIKGYGRGANLYLTKPFDPERLLKNIEVHFTGSGGQPHPKRLSMAQIREIEEKGIAPIAPGTVGDPGDTVKLAPISPPSQQQVRKATLPRIMVVDDEPDVVTMVSHTIGLQAEIVSANDGIQAIERLVRYQPDMMIIDIMIPRMSGFQLCQSLRSNRAFKDLPILVCSARCSDRDRQFALRVGANDFLAKPFTPTELMAKFSALVNTPGFRIRPKAVVIEDIRRVEATDQEEDVFQDPAKDARGDVPRTPAGRPKTTQEVVGDFLTDQKKKEVEDAAVDDEDKGKRRLFRFGKK